MSPQLAALGFAAVTIGLLLVDRERKNGPSAALWLPVIWLAIGGSRNVTVWLSGPGADGTLDSTDQYLEGSPLDRAVLAAMIGVGLGILTARGQRTVEVLRRNAPLLLFFTFCVVSAAWSDFPVVTLKRTTKAIGNVVMVLIVLTDPSHGTAWKALLTRTAILLIPSSVLLIKYYPEWGRHYDRWEGAVFYSGVSSDKNMLGGICMLLGLGLLWRLLEMIRLRQDVARQALVVVPLFATTVWLLHTSSSATSLACFVVGATIIVGLRSLGQARPTLVHLAVGGMCLAAALAYFVPEVFALAVGSLGRKSDLTGRTDLWEELFRLDQRPWFGAGFESFFLGERLDILWRRFWWHPNESHNGYIEIYLTLGLVGLGLLGLLLVSGYRNAVAAYRRDPAFGCLALALVIIAPIYNVTEAAFKVMNPVWILFLLAATAVPEVRSQVSGLRGVAIVPSDRLTRRTPRPARAGIGSRVRPSVLTPWAAGSSVPRGRTVPFRKGLRKQVTP